MKELKLGSFCAVCCVYHDDPWINASIESIYDLCDLIVFLKSDKPWAGSADPSEAVIQRIAALPDPDQKIKIIYGSWTSEQEQRNAGLEIVHEEGFDYCFVVDSDEVYDTLELERMMIFASCLPKVTAWSTTCRTYWKSPLHRIEPPEEAKALIFVQPGSSRFTDHRRVTTPTHRFFDTKIGQLHHLSYSYNNSEIRRKISAFSHAQQVVPNWFEQVWLAWDQDHTLQNLNPVFPQAYRHAVPVRLNELPPVLRRLVRKEKLQSTPQQTNILKKLIKWVSNKGHHQERLRS